MKQHARWRRRSSGWLALGWMGVLVALLLSGCATSSALTWQKIGPDAQSIVSLGLSSRNPPTLFAGSSGQGLFRSQDGGSTWASVNNGLPPGVTVSSIVPDPAQFGRLYLGTDTGIFVSDDNGDHWQSASAGLPSGADGAVTALLLSPVDPMTLYAGTAHRGIFVSHDGAKTWSASARGLPPGATVHALLAEPEGQGVRVFAALGGAGVYQLGDGSAAWTASSSGLPAGVDGLSLLAQPANPGGLYVGTSAGIYRSADDGASWKAVNDGLGQTPPQVFALALNDQQTAFIYAATSAGAYRSADGGATWDQVAAGIPADHPVVALAIIGSASSLGTIYAASGQVYRYPNTAGSAGGQIFSFVILGTLALLFAWLFFRQRRLLLRLTEQASVRSGAVPGGVGQAAAERPDASKAGHAETGEAENPAAFKQKDEAGSGDAGHDAPR
jgi:hypothetical protein